MCLLKVLVDRNIEILIFDILLKEFLVVIVQCSR